VNRLLHFLYQFLLIFASDWPHRDFDHPSKVLQIPVSEEARRKIMGGNAIRLLNLEGRL
jgi:predicted TIM-barrel fold metal-dependent hydrolase